MRVQALAVGMGAVLLASPAMAGTARVKAGTPRIVAAHVVLKTNSCEAGAVPAIRITDPPKHGTALVTPVLAPVDTPQCKGQKVRYGTVVYVPKPGYRGPDSLSYGFEYDTYTNETMKTWIGKSVEIVVE